MQVILDGNFVHALRETKCVPLFQAWCLCYTAKVPVCTQMLQKVPQEFVRAVADVRCKPRTFVVVHRCALRACGAAAGAGRPARCWQSCWARR